MAGGILVARMHAVPLWIVLCCWMLCFFWGAGTRLRFRTPFCFPYLLFFFCGLLLGASSRIPELESAALLAKTGKDAVRIEGTIDGLPGLRNGRFRMALREVRIETPAGVMLPKGRIRFTQVGDGRRPLSGERIRFDGKVKGFSNFDNPGGFDYRRHVFDQGLLARTWAKEERIARVDGGAPSFGDRVHRLRGRLGERIGAVVSTPDAQAVLKGVLIGDRSGIRPELREAFGKSGVGHLLAISGLHIGILAGGVFLLSEWLFRRLRAVRKTGSSRRLAAIPAAIMAIGYALVSGGAPSALRAVLMGLCGYFMGISERRMDAVSLIVVAVFGILVAVPEWVASQGFILSVTAVFGLVAGFTRFPGPYKKPGTTRIGLIGLWGIRLVKASLFASLATAGPVLFWFHSFPVYGIPANLILVPLFATVGIPLGMAGLLLGGPIGNGLLSLSGQIAECTATVTIGLASLPFSAIPLAPTLLEVGLLGSLLFLLLSRSWQGQKFRFALSFWLVVLTFDVGLWTWRRGFDPEIRVMAFDVGQGAAAVIRKKGTVVLVDGGGFPWKDGFDTGKGVIAPWLRQQKIHHLDLVVASHADSDHVKGLFHLLETVSVGAFWMPEQGLEKPAGRALVALAAEKGISVRHPASGEKRVGALAFRVFGPGKAHLGSANDNSLLMRLEGESHSMLFCGDICRPAEAHYVERFGRRLSASVLLVPHHGSRSSSTTRFITAVSPGISVVSAGTGGRVSHPHKEVVRRYEKAGIPLLTTQEGAVCLRFRKSGIQAKNRGIGLRDRLF